MKRLWGREFRWRGDRDPRYSPTSDNQPFTCHDFVRRPTLHKMFTKVADIRMHRLHSSLFGRSRNVDRSSMKGDAKASRDANHKELQALPSEVRQWATIWRLLQYCWVSQRCMCQLNVLNFCGMNYCQESCFWRQMWEREGASGGSCNSSPSWSAANCFFCAEDFQMPRKSSF